MPSPPPWPPNARACPPPSTTTHDVGATAAHVTPTGPLAVPPVLDVKDADFAAFVARNRAAMRDHVDATLRGTPDSDVDRDAVIQEALIRVWRDWPKWPTSDARRQAYLRRGLRLAALDAIRAVYGRDGRRPRELATDYAALERCDADTAPVAAELNRTLARQATSDATAVDERVGVTDALRALTDVERRAVLLSAH